MKVFWKHFTIFFLKTCSHVSKKIQFNENTFFKLDSIAQSVGESFKKRQIVKAEQQVLQTINFDLVAISVFDFVALYISSVYSLTCFDSFQSPILKNVKNIQNLSTDITNCADAAEHVPKHQSFSFVPYRLLLVCETLVDISVFTRLLLLLFFKSALQFVLIIDKKQGLFGFPKHGCVFVSIWDSCSWRVSDLWQFQKQFLPFDETFAIFSSHVFNHFCTYYSFLGVSEFTQQSTSSIKDAANKLINLFFSQSDLHQKDNDSTISDVLYE